MDDHVVHESPLRIEQRRILRLPDGQLRGVVHGNVLDRRQRFRSGQADVAHVADVEDAHASPHRVVLGHDSAGRGIFDRHVPAVEFDHFRAHLAMHGIKCSLPNSWGGFNCGQMGLGLKQWLGC